MQTPDCEGFFAPRCVLSITSAHNAAARCRWSLQKRSIKNWEPVTLHMKESFRSHASESACLSVCTVFVLIECALDKIHETRSCSVCFSFLLPFLAQSPETAGDGGECWCHQECVVVLPLAFFSFLSPVLSLIRCWVLNRWRTMLDTNRFKRASLPLKREILRHYCILLYFFQQHLYTGYYTQVIKMDGTSGS